MGNGEIVKAQGVLRRYAAGERDFRNANLRGVNFKGQDLSGANFSGADIRSANFTNATLRDVNFTQARAGLQRRRMVLQLLLITVIAGIAGRLQGFLSGLFTIFTSGSPEGIIAFYVYLLLVLVVYFAISLQGFTIRAFGSILTAFAVAFAVSGVGTFTGTTAFAVAVSGAVAGAIAVSGAVAFAFAVSVSGAASGAVAGAFVGAGAGAVAGEFAGVGPVSVSVPFADPFVDPFAFAFAFSGAGTGLLFSLYVGWRILKEDEKFDILRGIGLALAVWGGTSFAGADLTGAAFNQALLKGANFADSRQSKTNVTHVCWKQATQLNRARLGNVILQDRRIRTLLTIPEKGYKQDFSDANLRGANLSGVTLENAILRRAVLSDALLTQAILKGAILTEAQAVNADFTGAHLTGATLEAWNIDSTTTFQNIDCQYVFLREHPDDKGNRERRPHNPDKVFQPGDFEKFFKEMLDDVQILIRNGIEPIAFRAAFQKIMAEHPTITQDAIQSIQKKGPDLLMTLQVPSSIDKAKLEQHWDEGYQAGLKAGKAAGRLESADKIEQLAFAMAQNPPTIYNTNQNTNKNVAGDDQSQTIDTGDVNQSAVSMGDENTVSNQVSNPFKPPADDERSPST
ncbi:MAG: pentapeptide repeat-containing protein [Cyanobacteria bacterium P01_F01_bin.53]